MIVAELPLRGAGGEPISFARTVYSHGCAHLPPARIVEAPLLYRRALRVCGRIVEVTMRESRGRMVVETSVSTRTRERSAIVAATIRMFRLDEDLTPFYRLAAGDPNLAWACAGAGRMLASPSVFEDVIKTLCTTNCAWSATLRMTQALCRLAGGAFPDPVLLAKTPDNWYVEVARLGYRAGYVKTIAREVAQGRLDLESLRSQAGLTDDEVEATLLKLPGIGPYAAAHVMHLLGRHRRLVLDSWTRPKYRQVTGKKRCSDQAIRRAFARYGSYAGLAFWLILTRGWLDGDAPALSGSLVSSSEEAERPAADNTS